MVEVSKDIDELFIARLTGEISAEESERLDLWLEESSENMELYKVFWSEWTAGRWGLSISPEISSEAAWRRILQLKRRRKRIRIISGWSAAAAILLLVGFIRWWFPGDENISPTNNPFAWEKGKATLVLSTGEVVTLQSGDNDHLYDAGIAIISDSLSVRYEDSNGEDDGFNELIVPRGGEIRLMLADGSTIMLNSESRLRYPVTFRGSTHEVFLEGEACFDIRKDRDRLFIVKTAHSDILVTGTLFNVSAYKDDEETAITLVNGSVEVSGDRFLERMDPGIQLILNNETGDVTTKEVNAENFIAWTDGTFWFDALSLDELLKKLSRWFDIEYEFIDKNLKSKRYTGGFRKYDNLDYILEAISGVYHLAFDLVDGKIVINRK